MSDKSFSLRGWQWALAVLLLLCIVGLMLPANVSVQRETAIDAEQATVFALLTIFSREILGLRKPHRSSMPEWSSSVRNAV